jgi:hypothetical protein
MRPEVPRNAMITVDGRSCRRVALGFLAGGLAVSLPGVTFIACPFLRIARLPCPFCGSTTAFRQLRRANVAAAICANPLTCALSLIACWMVLRDAPGAMMRAPRHNVVTALGAAWLYQICRHWHNQRCSVPGRNRAA